MSASSAPAVIVGCMRSGTSLLRQILNNHPHLALFPESFLFRSWHLLRKHFETGHFIDDDNMQKAISFFLTAYNPYGHGYQPILRFLDTPALRTALMSCDRTPRVILGILMRAWAESQGKDRWGEKTTIMHAYEIATVFELFPQAQIVHIQRDPRAVSYSLMRIGWIKDAVAAARMWHRATSKIRKGLSGVPASQIHVMRYEDLCARAPRELERLCGFLQVDYVPEMLEYHQREDPVISNVKVAAIVRNLDKALTADHVADWHSGLTERQVKLVECINLRLMEQYGYSRIAGGPAPTMRDRLKAHWSRVDSYRRASRRARLLYLHLASGLSRDSCR